MRTKIQDTLWQKKYENICVGSIRFLTRRSRKRCRNLCRPIPTNVWCGSMSRDMKMWLSGVVFLIISAILICALKYQCPIGVIFPKAKRCCSACCLGHPKSCCSAWIRTPQSQEVNGSKFLFHTFAYATENYLCYAPSLHNICVKATKNDTRIFDFVKFMHDYSCTIYPLFVWYAFSAQLDTVNVFPLIDFKASVRLGYLDITDNGANTIEWLRRNVEKRRQLLIARNPQMIEPMKLFEKQLQARGLTPENTYLFMHGHTLMDNVVMVLLNSVCEKLRDLSIARINASEKHGVALRNEMSNYTNSLRPVRDVLLDNENYTRCPLYKRLQRNISRYIIRTIIEMKHRGEIRGDSYLAILRNLRQDTL